MPKSKIQTVTDRASRFEALSGCRVGDIIDGILITSYRPTTSTSGKVTLTSGNDSVEISQDTLRKWRSSGIKLSEKFYKKVEQNAKLKERQTPESRLDGIYVVRKYTNNGAILCPEWRNDKSAFKKWALDNGFGLNSMLVRHDNREQMSPTNSYIIDKESMTLTANARSNSHQIRIHDMSHTISEWCTILYLPTRARLLYISGKSLPDVYRAYKGKSLKIQDIKHLELQWKKQFNVM